MPPRELLEQVGEVFGEQLVERAEERRPVALEHGLELARVGRRRHQLAADVARRQERVAVDGPGLVGAAGIELELDGSQRIASGRRASRHQRASSAFAAAS